VAGPPALQDACPRTHTRRSTQTTIRDLRECVATQTCVVVRDECVVGSETCMGDIPATMRRRQRPTRAQMTKSYVVVWLCWLKLAATCNTCPYLAYSMRNVQYQTRHRPTSQQASATQKTHIQANTLTQHTRGRQRSGDIENALVATNTDLLVRCWNPQVLFTK
jgi:hypothetical protein